MDPGEEHDPLSLLVAGSYRNRFLGTMLLLASMFSLEAARLATLRQVSPTKANKRNHLNQM